MNSGPNIIIAGGKTGGHLFPGIAVAQALGRINPAVNILFVGTDAAFETQTLETYGYAHKAIISKPVKGGNIFSKAYSACILLVSLVQSLAIMASFKPDFVLGVGGFSSFAVVLSAWMLNIPTAIQEQNAIPGLTNRMLSKFSRTIFTAFKETKGLIDNPKVQYVGNPVRKTDPVESRETLDLNDFRKDRFTLLVTGGSQGARSINTAFMDALERMDNIDRFNIIHQTGKTDEENVRKGYDRLRVHATARAFFHNMPQLQDIADLVITRAGAGAISELCLKGLPAVLVPFPHAADDHQTFNARALEKEGAAIMIKDSDLTGQVLKETMERLINDRDACDRMAGKMRQMAMPGADEKIATHILNTKKKA